MFRNIITSLKANATNIAPKVTRQNTRGLASLKGPQVRLNNVKNMQNVTQSMKMVSVADLGKVLREVKNSKFTSAAIVELRPPTPGEIPAAIRDLTRLFSKSNWRELTVRQASLNALVATEVLLWFFIGECIGKGTLIGYQV